MERFPGRCMGLLEIIDLGDVLGACVTPKLACDFIARRAGRRSRVSGGLCLKRERIYSKPV
jgi:hypothetical protein